MAMPPFFMPGFPAGFSQYMEKYSDSLPLVCDLDGTLIENDSLYEGFAALLGQNFWSFLRIAPKFSPLALKKFLEPHSLARAGQFRINQTVLSYLKAQKAAGRKIYLATASLPAIAHAIGNKLAIFDGIFASSERVNLKGQAKADRLVEKFGLKGFDYIGDSPADLPVWQNAKTAVVVSSRKSLVDAVRKINPDVVELPRQKASLHDYFKLLRVRQWVKNIIVFLPLILAHMFTLAGIFKCGVAFLSLSFCASAIYVVNDICDLANDRAHPLKRSRPLASAAISLKTAPCLFFGCILVSGTLAACLPTSFAGWLILYFMLTIAYSLYLKKHLFIDVITLAMLYVLRIVAGAAVLQMLPSNWLLGFAFFFFLGLALFKRAGAASLDENASALSGRAWLGSDIAIIENMALCSGFSSIVIVALYIDSLQALALYSRPIYLWLVCPILVFWYGRLAILSHRNEIGDDPVSFATRDRVTWATLLLLLAVLAAAI